MSGEVVSVDEAAGTFVWRQTRTTETTFRAGWGVLVQHVWSGEDDPPERVVDIDVLVVRIAAETISDDNGPCVRLTGSAWCEPLTSFEVVDDLTTDDTHDLRSRWFATEAEAREHAAWVTERWAHPEPWESFVRL